MLLLSKSLFASSITNFSTAKVPVAPLGKAVSKKRSNQELPTQTNSGKIFVLAHEAPSDGGSNQQKT